MGLISVITGGYHSEGNGRAYFKLAGTTKLIDLGDLDAFSVTSERDVAERKGKNQRRRTTVHTSTREVSYTGTSTLMQLTAMARALATDSAAGVLTQAAVADGTLTVEGVKVGDIYRLPGLDGTITSATDGAAVEFVLGTHYEFEPQTGLIKVTALPAGGDGDLVIGYTLPAITSADNRDQFLYGSKLEIEGEMLFRSLTADGTDEWMDEFFNVTIRREGEWAKVGDDYQSVGVSMEFKTNADGAIGRHTALKAGS